MKRSKALSLTAVPLFAAAFTGCGDSQQTAYCIDQHGRVVQNRYCDNDYNGGFPGAYYYFFADQGTHYSAGQRISRSQAQGGKVISAGNTKAVNGYTGKSGGFGSSARSGGVGRAVAVSGGG